MLKSYTGVFDKGQKIIDDKALYFNDYNEYINWNLNYAKQFPNKLILDFGVEKGIVGKIISDFLFEKSLKPIDRAAGALWRVQAELTEIPHLPPYTSLSTLCRLVESNGLGTISVSLYN